MKNYKLTINYNENDYCFEGQFHSAEEFLAKPNTDVAYYANEFYKSVMGI